MACCELSGRSPPASAIRPADAVGRAAWAASEVQRDARPADRARHPRFHQHHVRLGFEATEVLQILRPGDMPHHPHAAASRRGSGMRADAS